MMLHTNTQPDINEYYFDDTSAIWQINRERVLLLTGIRVLLMQLAHPMVAASVYHHSYVFDQPLRRLHRTLTLTLDMVFGTRAEVEAAIAAIDAAHRPATGRLEEAIGRHDAGAAYNPRNPRQALWVYATLVEGAVSGYELLVAPLTDARKDDFTRDSALIAAWMGIPESYLPASYADLLHYMETAIAQQEVIVSDAARQIAPFVTTQSVPVINWLGYPVRRFNIALLPAPLREQYSYQIGTREQRLIDNLARISRSVLPYVPSRLRFAPEYHRAMGLK